MANEVDVGGDGELFVGEDKNFVLELLDLNSVPVDMTGWDVHMVVRLKDATPDPAIFDKTASISGVYSATRSLNTQRATTTLTDTELNTVRNKTYRWSWKRMDDSAETVLLYGDFAPQKATAA